MITNNEVVHLH